MGIWQDITDKDWKTWVGHALLGIVIFFVTAGLTVSTGGVNWAVCAAASTAYFLGREVTNIEPYIAAYIQDKTPIPMRKITDGFFDFWTPMFVSILLAVILERL